MGVLAHKYWTPKRLTWALAGILATAMLIAGFSLRLTSSTTTVVNHPRVLVIVTPKPSAKATKPSQATSTAGPFTIQPQPAAAPTHAQPQPTPAAAKQRSTPRPTSKPSSQPTSKPTPRPTPTPTPTCIRVLVASVCR